MPFDTTAQVGEQARLARLHALSILDTPPEEIFDGLVRAASLACGVPVALLSLVDQDRQWFKANLGLPGVEETPRDISFCTHAIRTPDVMEVQDATLDPRFALTPLVLGQPHIRFYAGAPLQTEDGQRIGTLCVIDRLPHALTDVQREMLKTLAQVAVSAIQRRKAGLEAHRRVAQSEARMRHLYETTPSMMHSIDAQGRLIEISNAWLAKLGVTREEALGRPSTDFLTPASAAHAREVVLPELFRTGSCSDVPYQIVDAQGQVRDVLVSAVLERDEEGRPLRTLSVAEDVTLRLVAERQLVEKRQRLLQIVDATEVGTWEWDLTTDTMRVNERYAALLGRTPAGEQVSRHGDWADEIHPEDRERHAAQLHQHLAGETKRFVCEFRIRHADGRWIWVIDRGCVIKRTEQGAPAWFFGARRDISQRKHEEVARLRAEELLDRTGRLAGVGGWEYDLDDQTVTWTAETRRIHGVAEDYQPTLQSALQFVAPAARPIIEGAMSRGLALGEPWDLEVPLARADGTAFWARCVGSVEFIDGRPVRMSGAVQDVTQRRNLELQLEEKERFLRRIADSLPIRIAYVGRDLKYRFVNQAHAERFDRSPEQIVGRTRRELTGGTTDHVVRPHVEAVLQGQTQRFEFDEMLRGSQRRIESHMVPDVDRSGSVVGFYSTGIDITERKATERALRDLTSIIDTTTDLVVQFDARGGLTHMNPAARRAAGLTPDDDLGGRTWRDFIVGDHARLFREESLPTARATGVWSGESVWAIGGQLQPISQLLLAHRGEGGVVERYSAVMRNISAQVRAQKELMRQAATLRSVTEAIPATVAVVDLEGRYRFVNGAFARAIGRQPEDIIGLKAPDVLGAAEFDRRWPTVQRAIAGEFAEVTLGYPRDGGIEHTALQYVPLRLPAGEVDGFVVVGRDVTDQKRREAQLADQAHRDPLTGVLNRAGFEQYLQEVLARGEGASLALLYIDLDHFKPVNDQFGHPAGDHVLRVFAQRLQALVRGSDAVARLGGDEFAVALLAMTQRKDVQAIAEKVLAAAMAPFAYEGKIIGIGASVGVAFDAATDSGWQDLVQRADTKLLAAKAAGRGQLAGLN